MKYPSYVEEKPEAILCVNGLEEEKLSISSLYEG